VRVSEISVPGMVRRGGGEGAVTRQRAYRMKKKTLVFSDLRGGGWEAVLGTSLRDGESRGVYMEGVGLVTGSQKVSIARMRTNGEANKGACCRT
jgi:hypothetical protein